MSITAHASNEEREPGLWNGTVVVGKEGVKQDYGKSLCQTKFTGSHYLGRERGRDGERPLFPERSLNGPFCAWLNTDTKRVEASTDLTDFPVLFLSIISSSSSCSRRGCDSFHSREMSDLTSRDNRQLPAGPCSPRSVRK